jgi:Protein of unknown function (DUF2786)
MVPSLSYPSGYNGHMGKNNRQRRAAKQRKRSAQTSSSRQHRGSTGAAWSPSADDGPSARDPATTFMTAVHADQRGDAALVEELIGVLATVTRPALARELQSLLELQVSHLWTEGWQPAVLDRVIGRELGRPEALLLRSVLAAEAGSYEALGREVAPDWMAQLESIEAQRWWADGRPYLLQLDQPWHDVIRSAVRLTTLFGSVPEIPILTPPPAEWRRGRTTAVPSNLPPGLLDRVRGLLAKAESTSFDAEADAFTAKAQELMTRHRIDRVVLESAGRSDDATPLGRRLLIDDPYADAKAILLQAICAANGGHAVWSKGMGFSTVFAFADELDIIEDLFTSLLVQSTAALRREGSKQDRYGRSRTTRFRRSFLVAFANRIGHRLQEATDTAVADAEAATGRSLVPVLASRATAAEEAAVRSFPQLSAVSPSVTDGEGWHAGTLFGDRADLGVGAPVSERAAS